MEVILLSLYRKLRKNATDFHDFFMKSIKNLPYTGSVDRYCGIREKIRFWRSDHQITDERGKLCGVVDGHTADQTRLCVEDLCISGQLVAVVDIEGL